MFFYEQNFINLPSNNSSKIKYYLSKIEDAKKDLAQEIKNNSVESLNIALQIDDIKEILTLANFLKKNFKQIIVLGVGGSSLGGKTLCSISKNMENPIIFMESIDSCSINNNLNKINNIGLNNCCFLVISKSGETIETICQTLILIESYRNNNIKDFSQNFIFITKNQDSKIAKIAQEIGAQSYLHPENIGGRFSYLTIVGLLPAAISGLDIYKIRSGAKKILENFLENDNHNIALSCALQLFLFDKNYHSNVIMPYIDCLKDFTDWYRQLWAESLGKNGFGSTPINSMGTIDQHSQLQLYLDGPKDKFFTFISSKDRPNNFLVKDLPNIKTLFGNQYLNRIVDIEQETTIRTLENRNSPIRVIEFFDFNEESVSALMMQMFLETILIAKANKIDPFDQPEVELRKDLARKILGDDSK